MTGIRLTLACLAVSLLGTCQYYPDTLTQIRELGELRVATRNSPLAYYLGAQGPEGPEYDLATRYAARLGVRVLFITCDSNAAVLAEVRSRRAHIGAAALPITSEGRRWVSYAVPYESPPLHVVYAKNTPRPDNPHALTERRVGVTTNSAHAQALQQATGLSPLPAPWQFDKADALDLLDRVSYAELDVTVADANEFATARRYHPDLQIAFNLPSQEDLAWALPRDDQTLAESVNRFFNESRGELLTLLQRYFLDDDSYGEYTGTRNFLLHVGDRLPQYRPYFEKAGAELGTDWRVLAALGYQESQWDAHAVSPTGVKGLMMLQADTASALGVSNRSDAAQSIFGGARYFNSVREMIPKHVQEPDRTWLALAAYNVGFGHLEDARILAQGQGKNPDSWQDVRAALPLLAQERYYTTTKRGYARGWEAVRFVDNIRTYLDLLDWLIPDPAAVQAGTKNTPSPAKSAG